MRTTAAMIVLDIAVLAAIASLASRFLRAHPARLRYRVWIAAATGALLMPFIPFVPSLWSVSVPSMLAENQATRVTESWLVTIIAVWICGAAAILISVVASTIQLNRIARRSVAASNEAWRGSIADAASALGVPRNVRVLMSEHQDVPVTWGIRQHIILLPTSALTWVDERRSLVLMHEFAHVARRDYVPELMLWVLCAFYWFHPAVWMIARKARLERERSCDESVISLGVDVQVYAEHLVSIMRQALRVHRGAVAGIAFARPSAFERRVESLLSLETRLPRSSRQIALSWGAVVVLLSVPIATPAFRQPADFAHRSSVAGHGVKKKCDCAAKRRARAHSAETMSLHSMH